MRASKKTTKCLGSASPISKIVSLVFFLSLKVPKSSRKVVCVVPCIAQGTFWNPFSFDATCKMLLSAVKDTYRQLAEASPFLCHILLGWSSCGST